MLKDLMSMTNTDIKSANDKTYIYKAIKGFPIIINNNIGFLILSRNINVEKLYKDLSPIMEEDFNYTVFKVKTSSKRNKDSLFIEVSNPTYKDKDLKTVGIFIFFGPKYLFSEFEIYGFILPFIPINKDTSSIMIKKYMEEGLFFRETTFLLTDFDYKLNDLYYYLNLCKNEIYIACIALKGSIPLYFAIYYEKVIRRFFEYGNPFNDNDNPFIYVNSFTGENDEDKDELRFEFVRTLTDNNSSNTLHIFESKKMDYSLDGSTFDKCFVFPFEKENIKKEKTKKNYDKQSVYQLQINVSDFLEGSDLKHFKKKINMDTINVMELLCDCDESIDFEKLFTKDSFSEKTLKFEYKSMLDKMKVLYVPSYVLQGFIITFSDFNELSENMVFMLYKVYTLMVNLFDVNINIVEIIGDDKNHVNAKNLYIDRFLSSYTLYEGEKSDDENLNYKFSTISFKMFKSNLYESFKNKRFFGIYISLFMDYKIPFKLNTGESIFSVCFHEDDLILSFVDNGFILEKEGGIINENFTFNEDGISIPRFVSFFPLFLQMMKLQGEKFSYYAKAYQKENNSFTKLEDFNRQYNNIMEYAWVKSLKSLFNKKPNCKIDHDINIMNFNNELFSDVETKNINYLISHNLLSVPYPKITLSIIDNSFLGFFASCYNYSSYMDVYSSMNFINLLKDQGYSVFPVKYQNIWRKGNCFYIGNNNETEYFKEHKSFDYVRKYFVLLPDIICDYFNEKPFVSGLSDSSKIYIDEMIETTYVIGFDTVMITGGVKSFISASNFEELSQMYETKIDSRWFLYNKKKIIEEIIENYRKVF